MQVKASDFVVKDVREPETNESSTSGCVSDDKVSGRIFKITVFLACLVGFVYQTYSFVKLFKQYPTVVQVDVEFANFLQFPAVTVCHNNRLQRSAVCSRDPRFCEENLDCFGHLKDKVIREFVSKLPSENVTQFSPHHFIKCRTETTGNETLTDICNDNAIVRLVSSDYPTCYSYNNHVTGFNRTPASAREGDVLTLELDMESHQSTEDERDVGAKLIIHGPYDAVYPSIEGFNIWPGYHYQISLKQTTKNTLPWPYHTNCTNYTEFRQSSLPSQGSVSRRMCVHDCLISESIAKCGCISTWLHVLSADKSIFCPEELQESCLQPEIMSVRRSCEESCSQSCETVIYETNFVRQSYPTFNVFSQNETYWEDWRLNNAVIKIFFNTREHTIYNYKPKYEGVELFSFIGGFVGIWLGISLVSLLDFIRNTILVSSYMYKTYLNKNDSN